MLLSGVHEMNECITIKLFRRRNLAFGGRFLGSNTCLLSLIESIYTLICYNGRNRRRR